jgi:phosphopantetheine adenylyltransferase
VLKMVRKVLISNVKANCKPRKQYAFVTQNSKRIWKEELEKIQNWVNIKTNGDYVVEFIKEHFSQFISRRDPE